MIWSNLENILNPFGIGPVGAIFTTCFVAVIVFLCVMAVGNAVSTNIKTICDTVKYVWDDLKIVLGRLADVLSVWLTGK